MSGSNGASFLQVITLGDLIISGLLFVIIVLLFAVVANTNNKSK